MRSKKQRQPVIKKSFFLFFDRVFLSPFAVCARVPDIPLAPFQWSGNTLPKSPKSIETQHPSNKTTSSLDTLVGSLAYKSVFPKPLRKNIHLGHVALFLLGSCFLNAK